MVVSLEAIFVTLAVLNNQNRMTYLADKRAHLDLQINLLAEQESTADAPAAPASGQEGGRALRTRWTRRRPSSRRRMWPTS
jgi:hypothetical protein